MSLCFGPFQFFYHLWKQTGYKKAQISQNLIHLYSLILKFINFITFLALINLT